MLAIVFELLFQFLAEVLLQLALELLAELGLRSIREPFRPAPKPWLAAIGYAILGAVAGALSLWIFPVLFMPSHAGRIANLVFAPLAAGAVMAAVGAWRRRREQDLIRLDRFAYGYLFALAMAAVRFSFGS